MRFDWDVVVVGAGINGAGVAQAAAVAGHSVLVLERSGIAAATSSKSSKLIHGGLRYLEQLNFALVRESLRERQILLRIAPDLVQLTPFYLPVYRDARRRPWLLGAGLSLYSLLGGMTHDSRFRRVPRSQWDGLDGLRSTDLDAVLCYNDARTDDAALTRAVLRSACEFGAEVRIPARFSRAELCHGGIAIHFDSAGVETSVHARVLVNAAGPWVNRVLEKVRPVQRQPEIAQVAGTHIEVEGTISQGCYYVESVRDARAAPRAVFVMPWHGHTLVGTTERDYTGDPTELTPTAEEQDYLVQQLREYFPRYDNARVLDAWSGIRILQAGPGAAFKRSRECFLVCDSGESQSDPPRLIGIYGGKLTVYRATAQKVLEQINPALPTRRPHGNTATIALPPDP